MKSTQLLLPLTFGLLCLGALTRSAPAQDDTGAQSPKSKAASTTPAMKLETPDLMVGTGFLGRFDQDAELPDIGEGKHYVITVFTDGKVQHATRDGDVGWMRMTLFPTGMMKLFEEQIEQNWERVSEGAIIGMTQMGLSTKDAAILMKDVKAFPEQIARARVTFSGNPQNELNGLQVRVSVTPAKNCWLGNLAKNLRPHAAGAPRLDAGGKKKPMMWLGVAIDPEGMNAFLSPALSWFAKISGKNRKEREAHANLYRKALGAQDGTYWMVGSPFGGGLRSIGGLRSARIMTDLMASPEYEQMVKIAEQLSPSIEIEFEAAAFKYRDIQVAKTTLSTDMESPLMPAGDQISYYGVAGDFLVSGSTLSEAAMKKLIDHVLDRQIVREKLPGNALVVGEFNLMELLDKLVPFGNPLEGEANPPKTLRVVLDNKDGSFHALLHFK